MRGIINYIIRKILFILAVRIIRRNKPEILAITGSIGKTTTKEMVYEVLRTKFKSIGKSQGNLNTEIGMPLSIFGFNRSPNLWHWPYVLLKICWRSHFGRTPKFLILEMAADKPGDIDYLCQIAPPKYGVVTAVGPSHLAKFKKIENVAKDKGRLVANLPSDGAAFLNESDPLVKEMAELTDAKIIYYNGHLAALSEAATKAVGKFFGIDNEKINEAINQIKNKSSRLEVHKLPNEIWLIDDAYNANPLSMKAAFEHFKIMANQKTKTRKAAILGEMLDLGDNAEKFHREIGELAHQNFNFIIGIGENAKFYNPNKWFANVDQAKNFASAALLPNDTVLVKGSHGVGLQRLVKDILIYKK